MVRTVNPLSVVVNNLLDQTHILQSPHGLSGQRSVDLHPHDEDGLGDHLVGGDLLEDLVAVKVLKVSTPVHLVMMKHGRTY